VYQGSWSSKWPTRLNLASSCRAACGVAIRDAREYIRRLQRRLGVRSGLAIAKVTTLRPCASTAQQSRCAFSEAAVATLPWLDATRMSTMRCRPAAEAVTAALVRSFRPTPPIRCDCRELQPDTRIGRGNPRTIGVRVSDHADRRTCHLSSPDTWRRTSNLGHVLPLQSLPFRAPLPKSL